MIAERHRNLEIVQVGHTLGRLPLLRVVVHRAHGRGPKPLRPAEILGVDPAVASLPATDDGVIVPRSLDDIELVRDALAARAEEIRRRVAHGAGRPRKAVQPVACHNPACGAAFTPKDRRTVYCSRECWARHTIAERSLSIQGRRPPPPGFLRLDDVAEAYGYTVSGFRLLVRRRGLPVTVDSRGAWMRADDVARLAAAGAFTPDVGGPKGPRPVPDGCVRLADAAAQLGCRVVWAKELLRRAAVELVRERGALFVRVADLELALSAARASRRSPGRPRKEEPCPTS